MASAFQVKCFSGAKTVFGKARKQYMLLLMLLPGFVYYIVYRYVPIFVGLLVSVKDYNLREGILRSSFADHGTTHFEFFFHSPYFIPLLSNTLLISFAKMMLGLPLAVTLDRTALTNAGTSGTGGSFNR
jgi:putative aldouronate transport system permease protein